MGNLNLRENLNKNAIIFGMFAVGFGTASALNLVSVKKCTKKIDWIEQTRDYSPSECMKELDKKIVESVCQGNSSNQQLADTEILAKKVLISGNLQCDQPMESKMDINVNNLIYRCNFCIVKYSNDELKSLFSTSKGATQEPKQVTFQYVPEFHLIDKADPEKKLEVWVHLNPQLCQSSINHYSERYTDRELSIMGKFRSVFSKVLDVIRLTFQREKTFNFSKGIEVGFNEYELGIKSTGSLAVIGDVVYNFSTKELKMINPLTIIGNKFKYIERLKSFRKDKYYYAYIFLAISGIFGYLLIREVKKLQRKGRMLQNQQQDSLKDIKQAIVQNINNMLCDECNNQNKQMIYKPCGHLVHCKGCSSKQSNLVCPTCKVPVTESIEIYLS